MSEGELHELYRLLTRRTGIELERGGLRAALDKYVLARASELGVSRVSDYVRRLDAPQGAEFERLVAIVTVPHTWFFRDPVQLDAIGQILLERARRVGRPLRVWVPACATGEDPYSLSLLIERLGLNARIVASDLCRQSLDRAESARYSRFSLRDLPAELYTHFHREGDAWLVSPRVRARVHFEQHNLMDAPLSLGDGWDLVLCRNVLIYFSAETGSACAERIASSLHEDGVAFFGAGELIQNCPSALSPLSVGARVAFRRKARALPGAAHHAAKEAPRRPSPLPPHPEASEKSSPRNPPPQSAPATPPLESSPQRRDPAEASSLKGAHALFESEDFESAARAYLSAAALDPTNAELRMYSGIALYLCGDFARGADELRAALLLDDGLWPAAVYSGLCLDSLGVPHQAESEYRHAVRLLEDRAHPRAPIPPILRGFQSDLLDLARRRAERHHRPD